MTNFRVRPKTVTALIGLGVAISLLACSTITSLGGTPVPTVPPPTPTFTPGEFVGYYVNSFEVSSFVPCDLAATVPGYAQGYWFDGNADFYKKYQEVVDATGLTPGEPGYGVVFIRFTGSLSEPGYYGHLGGYNHEIALDTLLEMETLGENQCEGN